MNVIVFPFIAATVFAFVWMFARLRSRSALAILTAACFAGLACGTLLTTLAVLPLLEDEQYAAATLARALPFGAFAGFTLGGLFGLSLAYTPPGSLTLGRFAALLQVRFSVRSLLLFTAVIAVVLSAFLGASLIGPLLLVSAAGIATGWHIQRRRSGRGIRGSAAGLVASFALYALSFGPVSLLLVDGSFGQLRPAVVAFYRPLILVCTSRPLRPAYETYVGAWLRLGPAEMRGWTTHLLAEADQQAAPSISRR